MRHWLHWGILTLLPGNAVVMSTPVLQTTPAPITENSVRDPLGSLPTSLLWTPEVEITRLMC